ncbi:class I SAM-dependent methyltransferase [Schinkia azotoformans]|uniref:class I SAM-dependent methyltransferase n=1 Tax=Schinkia azotoformans TaxID=1454 RepID=UPI002DBA9FFA|nr:class I SAM-dependent methyltransferase [Schinkia azotoformans]MEC1769002.1 class I SAM-dependent methyltransferase [Schinkia azotoformans]MEC1789587.1 class I SAM-dependent methyltransferase [Schinkia azotoformans]
MNKGFIPALKYKCLTKYFDLFLSVLMREYKIKNELIKYAGINNNEKILDFGCGTGTLLLMLKSYYPNNEINGVDIDKDVLTLANDKLFSKGLSIPLSIYDGENLPYESNYFDKILSSLVIHHIYPEDKLRIFNENRRILKPGGNIFILDFAKPKDFYSKIIVSILKRFEPIDDNIEGNIPDLLRKAGFTNISENFYFRTLFGGLTIYRASKLI